MSQWVAVWNDLGTAWCDWLIERSVVSGVTLAIVGVAVFVLRNRLSAHAPSHLLLLPLLVLVVPLERALPTRWPEPLPSMRFAHGPTPAVPTREASSVTGAVDGARETAEPAAIAPIASAVEWPNTPALLAVVWVGLLVGGVGRLIRRQRRADRLLHHSSHPATGALDELFAQLCSERGFDRPIGLRETGRVSSPVVSGVLWPIVYLPAGLGENLSAAQLRFVLLHELEHVARRDVLVEAAARVLRLGWMFHPGVWIAIASHARWREYACDEAALARSGARRRAPVADALFAMIEFSNDASRPSGAFAHLLSPRAFMKNRLNRILDPGRPPRRSLSAPSVLAIALASVGALTAARAQQSSTRATAAPAESENVEVVRGPAPATDDVVVALQQATAWLLQNQQPDGRWALGADPDGHNQRDHNEIHVTGLAIRALILELNGPRHGEIVGAIERGAAFLEQSQNESGRFGPEDPYTMMYGHAQALRALCAVQRIFPNDGRAERIGLGVSYAEFARNPYMGWRYMPRSNDNDSKITAMMLLALLDAADLGFDVDERALRGGRETLDQLTLADTGRTGFVSRGQTMSRFTSKKDDFPGELSEEPTAMALLVRLASGESIVESQASRRAIGLLTDLPPDWSRERGSIDYSYWSFGAQVMAHVGGAQARLWRERLQGALIPNRVVNDGAAHWPAVDAWSHVGMEAYATATAALALHALR